MFEVEVHSGTKFAVPDPVTVEADGGALGAVASGTAVVVFAPFEFAGAASAKAEAGSPPRVSASAAFRAYGVLTSSVRACSACPAGCTPSQRASPEANRSMGRPSGLLAPKNTV